VLMNYELYFLYFVVEHPNLQMKVVCRGLEAFELFVKYFFELFLREGAYFCALFFLELTGKAFSKLFYVTAEQIFSSNYELF
jgi:hypothetical protein